MCLDTQWAIQSQSWIPIRKGGLWFQRIPKISNESFTYVSSYGFLNQAYNVDSNTKSNTEEWRWGLWCSYPILKLHFPCWLSECRIIQTYARWVPSSRKSLCHPWEPSLTVQAPYFGKRTHNLKVLSFPRFALDRRIWAPLPENEAPERALSVLKKQCLGMDSRIRTKDLGDIGLKGWIL